MSGGTGAGIGSVLRGAVMALVLALALPAPSFSDESGEGGFEAAPEQAPAPAMRFFDGSGHPVGLGDFTGKLVLLNLWATWCGPCVQEMPSLDHLEARLGGADFQVVAVSVDQGGGQVVAPFLERHGLSHLAIYLDPEAAALDVWGAHALPTSILIDREGRVLGRLEGSADWDSPDVLSWIRHFLDRSPPAHEPQDDNLKSSFVDSPSAFA